MTRLHLLLSRRVYALVDRAILSSWLPAWLKQWVVMLCEQTAWLLEYEPSWFAEFGLAIGAAGWGLCNLLTDDFAVRGTAYVLPCLALAGGILRGLVLLRLWYEPRVVLAGCSALLWTWLWWGLVTYYGMIGMLGVLTGVFIIDLLTAAKFALPCARELRDDFLSWREAR